MIIFDQFEYDQLWRELGLLEDDRRNMAEELGREGRRELRKLDVAICNIQNAITDYDARLTNGKNNKMQRLSQASV